MIFSLLSDFHFSHSTMGIFIKREKYYAINQDICQGGFIMKTQRLSVLVAFFFIVPIIGCQTQQYREQNLDQYLQKFIGSSRADIQNNLDFKALGYQTNKEVISTDQELSYTILRPIYIPMAGSNTSICANAMGVPVIRYDTTSTPSYDINFNCKVTFKLKDDIAQSIQYSGRAC